MVAALVLYVIVLLGGAFIGGHLPETWSIGQVAMFAIAYAAVTVTAVFALLIRGMVNAYED